jgi:non-specific serine/threonine protein kinase
MGFADLLRLYRARAGLTQADLAKRSGLSLHGISDLERRARNRPYASTVDRLADALGLDDRLRVGLHLAARVGIIGRREPVGLPRGDPPSPARVPAPLTSFIGRTREVVRLRDLLQSSRLVELIGLGGVGKTRLALEVARGEGGKWSDGVYFVDLALVGTDDLVFEQIAAAIGLDQQSPLHPLELLVDTVGARRILLVLDNCEHVRDPCADLVDTLLRRCPDLRVLTTSRVPLGVEGEHLWRVSPLELPIRTGLTPASALESDAVRLFVERTRAVQPDFALSDANVSAVIEICSRLDGLPLALELAAARMPVLGPDLLGRAVGESLELIQDSDATGRRRQRTVQRALEWGYDQLEADARTLLRRLSAFNGGTTLAAIQAICTDAELRCDQVAGLLSELVDASLVEAISSAGNIRYRLLETVRIFAREQLNASGEGLAIRNRHGDYFLELVEAAEPQLFQSEQLGALATLDSELDNVRAALDWTWTATARGSGHVRLVSALRHFWFLRGLPQEGGRRVDTALSLASVTDAERIALLLTGGWMAFARGDLTLARQHLEESHGLAIVYDDRRGKLDAQLALAFVNLDAGDPVSCAALARAALELARELERRWPIALALLEVGLAAMFKGELTAAETWCAQSLQQSRQLGDRMLLSYALRQLARVAMESDRPLYARELYAEALGLARELGNRRALCYVLGGQALLASRLGQWNLAEQLHQEAVETWCNLGNSQNLAFHLEGLAVVAAERHQFSRAARLLGAAVQMRSLVGAGASPAERNLLACDQIIKGARRRLGDDRFDAAWHAGQRLMFAQAGALALDPSSNVDDAVVAQLSRRELEVARLIALGCSNREIATRLCVSVRTAEAHVTSCLAKLSLQRRSQLAVWATRQDGAELVVSTVPGPRGIQ